MTKIKKTTGLPLAMTALALCAAPFSGVASASILEGIGLSEDFVEAGLMIRPRFEYREMDGLKASSALTVRARPSLRLGKGAPLSIFAEVEATRALVDDYQSNPLGGPQTKPFNPGYTVIGDPEHEEVNQLYATLNFIEGVGLKVGRQRMVRNNMAFIGHVAWRQTDQTYDAVEFSYRGDSDFSASYAYANRVQRIFGQTSPADLPLEEFEGDFHFLDASIPTSFGPIAAYFYHIDLDERLELPAPAQNALANVGESTTIGLSTTQGPLYLEAAYQDGESALQDGSYEAFYGHVKYTKKVDEVAYFGGIEYWSDGFKTPLATVHLFNGFADSVVLQRIGLNNAGGLFEGMFNPYLGFSTPLPGGFVLKGFFHYLADESVSKVYGSEVDAVLVRKISDNASLVVKGAYFMGDEFPDISQVSIQIDLSL